MRGIAAAIARRLAGPVIIGRTTIRPTTIGLAVAIAAQSSQIVGAEASEHGGANTLVSMISGNGRYLAFASADDGIVPDDTNDLIDIFVFDRETGRIERVNVGSTGTQADGSSYRPGISADGRFVTFQSRATNLVPGDTNAVSDVFVHDRETARTIRFSVNSEGTEGDAASSAPRISADGRYIVFQSDADNLAIGDANELTDVFVHDRIRGVTDRISARIGEDANGKSSDPAISGDGRYIVFTSEASDLVADDSNGVADIFRYDRDSGEMIRVSESGMGGQGNAPSLGPAVDNDGRRVSFYSSATNLVPDDSNNVSDVFVWNAETGAMVRPRLGPAGEEANAPSSTPAISGDGRFVAFSSHASHPGADHADGRSDIFVYDVLTGETVRAIAAADGEGANGDSLRPSISADGRLLSFTSNATNLVADANDTFDIYLKNLSPAGDIMSPTALAAASAVEAPMMSPKAAGAAAGEPAAAPSVAHDPLPQSALILGADAADPAHPERSADGLVARWSFDEATGTTVADGSENANPAIVSGATWSEGRSGAALTFDGNDDFVAIVDSSALDVRSSLTLALWNKSGPQQPWSYALAKPHNGEAGVYWIGTGSSGSTVYVGVRHGANDDALTVLAYDAPFAFDDRWHHIAMTFGGGYVRLYIDGGELASTTAMAATLTLNDQDVSLGRYDSGLGLHWRGALDDVRIYARALSAEDIAALARGSRDNAVPPAIADELGADHEHEGSGFAAPDVAPTRTFMPENYGAVGDGFTDDTDAFKAMHAAIMAAQDAEPDLHVVIRFSEGAAYTYTWNKWSFGIRFLTLEGNGASIRNVSPGPRHSDMMAWWTNRGALQNGPGDSLGDFIENAPAGATAVTLKDAARAADFVVGLWALVASYSQQNGGWPPNARYFDYVKVASVHDGTVSFDRPLAHEHRDDWPSRGAADEIAEARIVPAERDDVRWAEHWIVRDLKALPNPYWMGDGVIHVDGFNRIEFENVDFPHWSGGQGRELIFRSSKIPRSEPDKLLSLLRIEDSRPVSFDGASGVDRLEMIGCYSPGLHFMGRQLYVEDTVFDASSIPSENVWDAVSLETFTPIETVVIKGATFDGGDRTNWPIIKGPAPLYVVLGRDGLSIADTDLVASSDADLWRWNGLFNRLYEDQHVLLEDANGKTRGYGKVISIRSNGGPHTATIKVEWSTPPRMGDRIKVYGTATIIGLNNTVNGTFIRPQHHGIAYAAWNGAVLQDTPWSR